MDKTKVVGVRLPADVHSRLAERGNVSDIMRLAVNQYLDAGGKTSEALILESLRDLIRKSDSLDLRLKTHEMLFSFFLRYFFIYAPKIPDQMKETAGREGTQRYERFKDEFRKNMENDGGGIVYALLSEMMENMQEDE